MITRVHAQVVFQGKSNIPADRFVNVWSFGNSGGFGAPEFADLGMLLNQFYCAAPSGDTDPIMNYMSRYIQTSPLPVVNFYDADAVGSPVGSADLLGFTPGPGVTDMPQEVALVLSFHGDTTTVVENGPIDPVTGKKTRPRARRRGRIYLGPLTVAALKTDTSGVPGRPDPVLLDIVNDAATRLLHDPDGLAPGSSWSVHSRKENIFHEVVGGFVDNDFDTQRRRSSVSTSRLTFS